MLSIQRSSWSHVLPVNFPACQLVYIRASMKSMFVAFCNQKGGVGKSTLSVHAAVYLHEKGVSVGLLDADKQRSSSQWLSEAEPTIPVAMADDPDGCLECARKLSTQVDIIIADGPGGLNDVSRTILLLADLALFPIGPSILDLRSVSTATAILRYAQQINGDRPEGALVLNKMRLRDRISRELQASAPQLGIGIARSPVRDLQAFRDAAQQGTVVWRLGDSASAASNDTQRLCSELFAGLLESEKSREVAFG